MFGLSITKILFTAAVIFAVLYGWKWLGRIQAQRNAQAGRMARKRRWTVGKARAEATKTEDMVRCPTCGDYVPAERPRHCGRENCPYPG